MGVFCYTLALTVSAGYTSSHELGREETIRNTADYRRGCRCVFDDRFYSDILQITVVYRPRPESRRDWN